MKNPAHLIGCKVRVYRNLHRKTFSIMNLSSRLIGGYSDSLVLSNVSFKVSKAGLKRARKNGQRNVHAFAEGILTSLKPEDVSNGFQSVSYHYKKGYFFVVKSNKAIKKTKKAVLLNGRELYTKT